MIKKSKQKNIERNYNASSSRQHHHGNDSYISDTESANSDNPEQRKVRIMRNRTIRYIGQITSIKGESIYLNPNLNDKDTRFLAIDKQKEFAKNDWVCFSGTLNTKKAQNLSKLEVYNDDVWEITKWYLRYIRNVDVVSIVLRKFEIEQIVSSFCEYVSSINDDNIHQTVIERFVDALFIQQPLCNILSIKDNDIDDNYRPTLKTIKKQLIDRCEKIDDLSKLPESNDLFEYKEQIISILKKEYLSSTDATKSWLNGHENFFKQISLDEWNRLKTELQYVVFDLESDGENISEFAFVKDGKTNHYNEAESIDALYTAISHSKIVVGHHIKKWDLKVLKQNTELSMGFVWDTLEMEILLNPCRYAYSLNTTHKPNEDAELTDKLFWNQLFRLAMDNTICEQLSRFLPEEINTILEKLRQPILSEYFKIEMGKVVFFHNRLDIEEGLIQDLQRFNNNSSEKTLIISPKRFWNRISEHMSLSFIREDEDKRIDYSHISKGKLENKPLEDPFRHIVLLRFCELSKTPIVSNLAPYLRLNYFDDSLLNDYVEVTQMSIQCADLQSVDGWGRTSDFGKIYLIGCELENRLNQYTLREPLKPSELLNKNSSLLMRSRGSNYAVVSSEERKSDLFGDVPENASKVWIEKTNKGNYLVNYNYNFSRIINELAKERNVELQEIPWFNDDTDMQLITLVRSGKPDRFDYLKERVNSTTPYRSKYWMYQLALLNSIHLKVCSLPIVYILEDDLEIEQVENYAKTFGFYIPKEGALMTRLEKIAKGQNGMLVVSKDQFFEITEKRLFHPYCYIWDQMAIEKHMMMWSDFDSSIGDGLSNEGVAVADADMKRRTGEDTYHASIISVLTIFQYYNRFILANSGESKMFILDSIFDEYCTSSRDLKANCISSDTLWKDKNTFDKGLEDAREYFRETNCENINKDESFIRNAMDVILNTLVPAGNNGNRAWTPIQEEVLPEILSKKGNYFVSMPTGGGKSVLFQGPALFFSSYTNRLSLVVTPLRALMQDQVKELTNKGFYTNVDYLNSDRSYQETKSIYRKIKSGELSLLYVTPERFRSRGFIDALTVRMTNDNGLEYIIFDEAHCISQWGMEFRPEYLNALMMCKGFAENFKNICIVMFSATVTRMIFQQIDGIVPVKMLGQDSDNMTNNPIRNHIGTSFKQVDYHFDSRVMAIVKYVEEKKIDFSKSRMLVFCRTHSQCEELSAILPGQLNERCGLDDENWMERVGYFHAGMDSYERDYVYSRFKSHNNPIYILCATKAFGMGMDIPNIHYIIHLSPPESLEDYLQEVGRAGRNEQMYEDAGFNQDNPIPAVCLHSTEDIPKLRELLLWGVLSWQNLENIRINILKYISNIQTIEATKKVPVVVPNNLWSRSEKDHEFTDFKLGEYWLERMGRIKMGYASSPYVTITVNDSKISLSSITGKLKEKVYNAVDGIAKAKGSNTIQVSLQQIANELSVHTSNVMNELIACSREKLLSINHDVRCRIANTRLDEVHYMLTNKEDKMVALCIIVNTAERILEDIKELRKEKTYTDDDIRQFMKSAIEGSTHEGDEEHMPWYNNDKKDRNNGLSIFQNYMKDLNDSRFRQIFTLFDLIPDVKCKSYIDRRSNSVKQSIMVERNTWKKFLNPFTEDCLKTLKHIYDIQQNGVNSFNPAEAINTIELQKKDFNYFNNIVRYLSGMAYIVTDSLLPTGVEILCTDDSEEPIKENVSPNDKDYKNKNAFDEAMLIRNLRLCVMDVLTSRIGTREQSLELINAYFSKTDAKGFIDLLQEYCHEGDPIRNTIWATAMREEENRMKNNQEQWNIYYESSDRNINVEAGPGSGKTHVLTMRCAKLIYWVGVKPSQILVLAYNRGVVSELKSRLTTLFTSLGLSRSAAQLNVYTFHGLAMKVCGEEALMKRPMSEWEEKLLELMKSNRWRVEEVFSEKIKYIMIDEFQDITQTRLDLMFELGKIFNPSFFFTIGDKNQSIYGFERGESISPDSYYEQLEKTLNPESMSMTTNYRSYPKILEKAAGILFDPDDSGIPVPCQNNKENEPKEDYAFIYNSNEHDWVDKFKMTIDNLRAKQMTDVAVLFRTNNEVYRGYSLIRMMNISGIRLRVQGASECELFRKREFYDVIHMLEKDENFGNNCLTNQKNRLIKEKIESLIDEKKTWDSFYLDFAYTLVLEYVDSIEADQVNHTYEEMAKSIRLTLTEENAQLYKIYNNYKDKRILKEDSKHINVVLTTMHKVKGLEFDAIIITPSSSSLPFNSRADMNADSPLSDYEKEYIEEEKRLLYVAFTRAKKYLVAYFGERENAILNMRRYAGPNDTLGICEPHPNLGNYYLGFNTIMSVMDNCSMIGSLPLNTPVSIKRDIFEDSKNRRFNVYNIVNHQNGAEEVVIGRLSQKSSIARTMEDNNLTTLDGFFVSDIYCWSFQDSEKADGRNGAVANYAGLWSEDSREKGFVYVVGIAGYGISPNE